MPDSRNIRKNSLAMDQGIQEWRSRTSQPEEDGTEGSNAERHFKDA